MIPRLRRGHFPRKNTFNKPGRSHVGNQAFFCAPPKHHSGEIELKAFANFDIISGSPKHVATTAKHETCNI